MPESIFNLKIFQGIDKAVVENIIIHCEEKNIGEGTYIIKEGELSNGEGYIIKNGSVSISIGGSHVAELGSGDIFGEIALLNEEERTASVKSISDITVIILNIDNLVDMINNDENKINKEIIRRIEENLENS